MAGIAVRFDVALTRLVRRCASAPLVPHLFHDDAEGR
jgi:hypothetical protein